MSTSTLAALSPDAGFVLTPKRRRRLKARFIRQGFLLDDSPLVVQLRNAQRLLAIRRLASIDAADLREVAEEVAPNKVDKAIWSEDCHELADKIDREKYDALLSFEAPVRDADRQMLAKNLAPGIEAQKNDPPPFPWTPNRKAQCRNAKLKARISGSV